LVKKFSISALFHLEIFYEQVIGKLASLQEIQKIGAKDKLHLSIRNHDIIIEKLNSSGKFTPVSN